MTDTSLRLLDHATRPRRRSTALPLVLAGIGVLVVVATMGVLIARTQQSGHARIQTNFQARGSTSAEFVSALITAEAGRQERAAGVFLTGAVTNQQLNLIAQAFGSRVAAVLDAHGRLLAVAPAIAALTGASITQRFPRLAAAETGRVAVSGNLQTTPLGPASIAIAVPYATPHGLRVFAVALPVAVGTIADFLRHTLTQSEHAVFLVDSQGRVLASNPQASATTLAVAAPALANARTKSGNGTVILDHQSTTFSVDPVAGTDWRLIVAEPTAKLFASVSGAAHWLPWLAFAVVALLAVGLWAFFASFLADRRRLACLSQEVLELARTDLLTGLPNRLQLSDSLTRALAGAERYEQPLSLLMIDLDNFKEINDAHGHETGDRVLRSIAACLREVLREADLYGRWGGDEFLAVLVHTPIEGARQAGQRLCDCAAALNLSSLGIEGGVTMSVGCAPAVGELPELLRTVDGAMYEAKRAGRGRVSVASGPEPTELAA